MLIESWTVWKFCFDSFMLRDSWVICLCTWRSIILGCGDEFLELDYMEAWELELLACLTLRKILPGEPEMALL